MTAHEHTPVLVREVLSYVPTDRAIVWVDGTLGLGGHSEALLQANPSARVIGVEWDAEALAKARQRLAPFGDRFTGVEGSYADLPSHLAALHIPRVDGLLLDLGLSSFQLQDSSRGFSFLRPGPLDMRMSQSLPTTAWQIIQRSSTDELARLFRQYGEEPQARKIAQALQHAIHQKRLSNDAWAVAELIRHVSNTPQHRIDPATRCFQALRIVVNGEMGNIDRALAYLPDVLATGGRAVFISFHSLEDRKVKVAFHAAVRGCVCPPRFPQCMCGKSPWGKILTKKPITAQDDETSSNPRARSAKLRVLEHL